MIKSAILKHQQMSELIERTWSVIVDWVEWLGVDPALKGEYRKQLIQTYKLTSNLKQKRQLSTIDHVVPGNQIPELIIQSDC